MWTWKHFRDCYHGDPGLQSPTYHPKFGLQAPSFPMSMVPTPPTAAGPSALYISLSGESHAQQANHHEVLLVITIQLAAHPRLESLVTGICLFLVMGGAQLFRSARCQRGAWGGRNLFLVRILTPGYSLPHAQVSPLMKSRQQAWRGKSCRPWKRDRIRTTSSHQSAIQGPRRIPT